MSTEVWTFGRLSNIWNGKSVLVKNIIYLLRSVYHYINIYIVTRGKLTAMDTDIRDEWPRKNFQDIKSKY